MGASAPDSVRHLVDHFYQDRRVFLSGDYEEEQLRSAFPNGPCLTIRHSDFVVRTSVGPFFTALGWDMDNRQGLSETFKQVIHEESIKVAGASSVPSDTLGLCGTGTCDGPRSQSYAPYQC